MDRETLSADMLVHQSESVCAADAAHVPSRQIISGIIVHTDIHTDRIHLCRIHQLLSMKSPPTPQCPKIKHCMKLQTSISSSIYVDFPVESIYITSKLPKTKDLQKQNKTKTTFSQIILLWG